MNTADQLPRAFQANVGRFYKRVILATLDQLRTHDTLVVGQADTMDEFLDRCAAQVDNHTANEAAKAFVLTLDGMFERQLSRLARARGVKVKDRDGFLKDCALIASIDLSASGMASDLTELHLVANTVRHGEGWSCLELKAIAPQLWDNSSQDYYDLAPGPVPASDELRIQADDLRRYVRAIVRFWGHVDRLPMAVLDPPF